ncbi:MAG: nucleotidyltransferase family protein [Ruminococcus sp.]|nr:nucleotidyltransferase family protein [Ruminococcus sp.]
MADLKKDDYRLGAVIPAAGLSSRMGAFKPLLPYLDSTVIGSAVDAVMPYTDRVTVVLGYRADEVRKELFDRFGDKVKTVVNPDYRSSDMLRSVQLGLESLGDCDGFFLLPGDMPAIAPSTFETLLSAFDGEKKVIYPVWNGRRGHPPLIHAALIPEIMHFKGSGGLRAILEAYPAEQVLLNDNGIMADLDTPEDYAEITKNIRSK